MASKKKRNKKYRGRDAVQMPQTIRVTAKERSKFGSWFHDNKQVIATRSLQAGLALILISILYWIFF